MPRTEPASRPARRAPRPAMRVGFTTLIAAALWLPLVAGARPVVVFTFDVESQGDLHMDQQLDPVCDGGARCGVMEMTRMLAAHRFAGTFFVNPYEQAWIGTPAVRGVATALDAAGQDVELHTHPESAYDPKRHYLYEYSLDEQIEIVRAGAAQLHEWTGKPVVAHRAGAYSADANTLTALARNGILWDSSAFWQHPHSHLDRLNQPRNLPWSSAGVSELPVNVYQRVDHARILGLDIESHPVIRKLDVDWIVNAQEARDAMASLIAADVPVIMVFAHSFSFIDGKTNDGTFRPDHLSMELFRAILDEVVKQKLEVRTLRDFAAQPPSWRIAGVADPLPRVVLNAGMRRALISVAKEHRATALTAAAGLGAIASIAAAWWLRRRLRRKPA